MKIEKIHSITISKELDLLWLHPAKTELVITNPEAVSLNIEAGEARGGVGNGLINVLKIDPQELFGDGVTVVADAIIDPEDGGELFNDEVTLFPQFSINMKGALHNDVSRQI